MSTVGREGRSYKAIAKEDLSRLAKIAARDRDSFFTVHKDWAALYKKRLFATALCQGAALHYLRGDIGIQDFDVYSFFASHPKRPWYAKRNKHVDFGSSKFGKSPSSPNFIGRRVDLLGRGIEFGVGDDPADAIRRWLLTGRTRSSRYLAQKAVILLSPARRMGEVVWPLAVPSSPQPDSAYRTHSESGRSRWG